METGKFLRAAACAAAVSLAVAVHAEPAPPGAVAGAPLPPVADVRQRVATDPRAAAQLAALEKGVRPYVARHRDDPAWIVSRLQMYWQDHHTQVFVRNGVYDHAEGRAPVPTVRFTGARDAVSAYLTPRLEDVKPYMGEGDKLWLQRRDGSQAWEWVEQSKSGRVIESINMRIAELARDAAFLYWYQDDAEAARFAYDILDTYLSGMFYRELPSDLRRGHDQNIVGLQSFEVIHEDIIGPLTETYSFLQRYAAQRDPAKRQLFDGALKKWADVLLLNGVPWNNWNLIKARFVLQVASVLGDDAGYADGKGRQYYLNAVLSGHGPRHWSLQRLMEFGYDPASGMWNESPGYSMNVFGDFTECLEMLERVFGIDYFARLPALPQAARALPQYLLPNGRTVGFGDTRYELPRIQGLERLLAHAERKDLPQAGEDRQLLAALRNGAEGTGNRLRPVHALVAVTESDRAPAAAAPLAAYQSPTYHSANTSWLIQRNGYAARDAANEALAVSLVGSNGNHAHANGLAMEVFAKGWSLAPESGRGSGYFQSDYADYYSQFPAHNTVVVDGNSAYPAMKIAQPFKLLAAYPAPGAALASAYPGITFGEASFIEPATQADQRRLLATVRIDDRHAYVVDVFRSRRREGGDRYHDYLYHGLAQTMQFSAGGAALPAVPTTDLSFAGGDLTGYEYWFDKQALKAEGPLQARFDLKLPDDQLSMRLWLQGGKERQFYSVKAPPSTSWEAGMLPKDVAQMPSPTLVVRQYGPAWARPFAVVMEASRKGEQEAVQQVTEFVPDGGAGEAVGLDVRLDGGRRHTFFSSADPARTLTHGNQSVAARFGVAGVGPQGLEMLFLGDGRRIGAEGYSLECVERTCSAALWRTSGGWRYSATGAVRVRLPAAARKRGLLLPGSGPAPLPGT